MIRREDILSMEFLKKSEFTGSSSGMRYRLELSQTEEGKVLKATIWPEPFNYITVPVKDKRSESFDFSEDGVHDAIAWMNDKLFEEKEKWGRVRGTLC